MKARNAALFPLILALGFAGPALVTEAGDWGPAITGEYFFTPNLGLEVLACLPFKHDLSLNGAPEPVQFMGTGDACGPRFSSVGHVGVAHGRALDRHRYRCIGEWNRCGNGEDRPDRVRPCLRVEVPALAMRMAGG